MIKKFFSSILDNVAEKTTNPFLGTFFLVWGVKNWELIYSILYFDSNYSLNQRIQKIKSYTGAYEILDLWDITWKAFIVLIVTYSLVNISRLIINFFEKTVTPLVYNISDKSNIVLKSEYLHLFKSIEKLEIQNQEEREARLKIQAHNEQLEDRIKELLSIDSKKNKQPSKESVESQDINSRVNLLYRKLEKDSHLDEFYKISQEILNEIALRKSMANIREYTGLGLISPGKYHSGNSYFYTLTDKGHRLYDKILEEKIKMN